jgi:hypothetical protein
MLQLPHLCLQQLFSFASGLHHIFSPSNLLLQGLEQYCILIVAIPFRMNFNDSRKFGTELVIRVDNLMDIAFNAYHAVINLVKLILI